MHSLPTADSQPIASLQDKLQADTNYRFMQLLHYNPDLTPRGLAEQLRVSVMGLLTPSNVADKAARMQPFMQRKIEENKVVKSEIEAMNNMPKATVEGNITCD